MSELNAIAESAAPMSQASVHVPLPSLVYIIVECRAVFDAIAGAATAGKAGAIPVLSKSAGVIGGDLGVIFQHFPKTKT